MHVKDDSTTAVSADGTVIAYEKVGQGPPVVLVGGAFNTRDFGPNAELAPLLAEHFTVVNYDRRGRGGSGDTAPYSVAKEIEDLAAVIDTVGGSAAVYGISSGAALALEAARAGLPITRLALFEAPFVVDGTRPPIPDYAAEIDALIAQGRASQAIKLFMRQGVLVPGFVVAMMPLMPAWKHMKSLIHTLPYDVAVLGDTGRGLPLPAERYADVTLPTLVVSGGKSPEWSRNAMAHLAGILPSARLETLPGQTHIVKAKALGPVLIDFLRA
ncbi:alpha/beta fold hydrolase [Actinocorallia sp. A-T 12471]|uniref:alpha/beta fold hydrolase n=1 Tax=Actinocorallia sp. A-T 12471 TaxID=3089813 RepID=UPI0029D282D7|nr:alpha/beta fold hydrolase [Actinocorallia sp. A-T 12471]MDX6741588.1 alpha/beta fold hydrolase [Actinocorallia sp. A-T 12471]